jgi:hypothetical protein
MEEFFISLENHPGAAFGVALFIIIVVSILSEGIADIIKSFRR